MSTKKTTPFGKEFRKKYFSILDPEVVPVNHGSYGLSPASIIEKYCNAIKNECKFSDEFLRIDESNQYLECLRLLGQFLKCDYHNLALVDNATTGVNTVLRSLPFKKGDKIVMPTTISK